MKKAIFSITISLLSLLVAGVWVFADRGDDSKSEPTIHKVSISADRAVATDVDGLVNNSDYIVVGHYKKHIKTINIMQEPGYGEGEVYTFVVEQNLLGESPKEIEVLIPHFLRHKTQIEGQTYAADITEPHYYKPNTKNRYTLFLKKYEPENLYTPSSVPFQVETESNGKVSLKYNNGEMKKLVQASNGEDVVEFSTEVIEGLESNDKISGKTESILFEEIANKSKFKKKE